MREIVAICRNAGVEYSTEEVSEILDALVARKESVRSVDATWSFGEGTEPTTTRVYLFRDSS